MLNERSALRVLAKVEPEAFGTGGTSLERIIAHGNGGSASKGLAVLSRPGSGSSELMRQAYDRIFSAAGDVVPFYFQVKASDRIAHGACSRYLAEFLAQFVAFRRQDPSIIHAMPEPAELLELAPAGDKEWMEQLIARSTPALAAEVDRAFIRNCLSVPFRKFAADAAVFVMVDDLHDAVLLDGGVRFVDDLLEISSSGSTATAICAHRRFLYDRTDFPAMRIDRASSVDAGRIVETIASRHGITITEQTRDLIAVQLDASPKLIDLLLRSASETMTELTSFADVQKVYTDEIFGGRISRHFDRAVERYTESRSRSSAIFSLLQETGSSEGGRLTLDHWRDRLGLTETEFDRVMRGLFEAEVINIDGDHVIFDRSDIALTDHAAAKASLHAGDRPRAVVVAEAAADNLRRAPRLMARFYKKNSSLGLLELIRSFDGRSVSPALLDYSLYRDGLKGAPEDRVLKAVQEDNARTSLPDVIFSAYTSAFYPQFEEVCQKERSVTAISAANTVWMAAEVESKLEASRELAEFWCDRLEMAAINSGYERYRIWLIAPEGFSRDAMDALAERGAIGSSRRQAELLAQILLDKPSVSDKNEAAVYEFVIPMGDETEMIAAHTIEEIARHHHVPPKSINQIKTALIEACINAVEHSHSPDRRIYQTVRVDAAKVSITVANRGVRLTDRVPKPDEISAGRRGWGLRLIQGLMDEVTIDETDDGTRITMVKYLQTRAENVSEPTATGAAG